MEFSLTTRGARCILFENHVYVKQKDLTKGVQCWECEKRRDHGCKGKIHVKETHLEKKVNVHNHAGNKGRTEVVKIRESLKRKAESTEEAPQQMISQAMASATMDAAFQLPSIDHVRRAVRRNREKANGPEQVPRSRAEIVLPQSYKETTTGAPFLAYDSGEGDENRLMIFATAESLALLASSRQWYSDGTFKTVPQQFFQLYTVHRVFSGKITPCVFCLMPNKRETTYVTALQKIKEMLPTLPLVQSVMMDFEPAAKNAFHLVFPDCDVKGCFFHLSQCIYRKVQSLGYASEYHEEEIFSLAVCKIAALAFVPQDDVIGAFENLEETNEDPRIDKLLDYFQSTYIGRRVGRHGHRRNPPFPPEMWNVYSLTESGQPRTNNSCEGWHRRFQSNIGAYHPTLWKFLRVLQREEALCRTEVVQLTAGHAPPAKRRKYKNCDDRLQRLVSLYNDCDMDSYLKGIAHNVFF